MGAKRKKAPLKRPVIQLKVVPVRRLISVILVLAVTIGAWRAVSFALDIEIRTLTIDAPFQRVSSMQIQEALSENLRSGFVSVSLSDAQKSLESLPWVDKASVRRVWPDAVHVSLTEQVPAARWGERGLLNVRGELFVENARHLPVELPRLSGPDAEVAAVARRYLALRGPLIEAGLGLRAVRLDARGAWQIVLGNGIEVRLGRKDSSDRADRFVDVASPVVARHAEKIRYVDMRYSNGFSIGWKKDEFRQLARIEAAASNVTEVQGSN